MNAAIDQATKTGFTSRLPAEVYHALPGISITRLKELQVSGLHYQYRLMHGKETTALTLGTAAHCAVLEPERFAHEFAAWSRRADNGNLCPRKGQYWDAFVARNAGKTIITEDDMNTALTLANAVRGDPVAMRYLASGDAEVSMQWQLRVESLALGRSVSVNCRGRADWLTRIDGEHYLVGLKTATARNFPSMAFSWAAYRLGYHMQWAFYQDGYKTLTGVRPKVKEIVVESTAPHDVVVYDITDDVLEKGREDYEALLRTLVDCESRDEWLGIAGGREQTFTLPSRVYETFDDISDLGLEA
jgi:hypothetical protein